MSSEGPGPTEYPSVDLMRALERVVFTHKPERWLAYGVADVDVIRWAFTLPSYPLHGFPMSSFPEARPRFHVIDAGSAGRFLIDTEGSKYARRMVMLPIQLGDK